jgi:hypothetical protein
LSQSAFYRLDRRALFRFAVSAMDVLTFFGLAAVTAMLVFYALENRSPWFSLAFAGACALGSIYGFLQGAWPFGIVEAIWALVAANRWRVRKHVAWEFAAPIAASTLSRSRRSKLEIPVGETEAASLFP